MRGPSALSGEGGVLCLGEPYGDPPRAQSPLSALTVTRPLLRADDEPIKGVVVLRRVHSHLRRLLPVRPLPCLLSHALPVLPAMSCR